VRGDELYAVGEAAGSACPVTIIKDSPRRAGRKRTEEEGGKNRANASLIIRSPRLGTNGPGSEEGKRKLKKERKRERERRRRK